MTQLFRDLRIYGYVAVLVLSATVLGLGGYLGSIFLPDIHRDFTIFTIIVPSLTILSFLTIISWSQPRVDAFFLFVLGVLWLAMGAWSADIMGSTQCDTLGGQRVATKDGSISAKSYCYEMRVLEAFSWMNFALLTIYLLILISRTTATIALENRPYAWQEPIVELPWFGQYPGWPEDEARPYRAGGYSYPAGAPRPGMSGMSMMSGGGYPGSMPMQTGGGYVVQQNPGHSVVIQPGSNGQAPTITQVPGMHTTHEFTVQLTTRNYSTFRHADLQRQNSTIRIVGYVRLLIRLTAFSTADSEVAAAGVALAAHLITSLVPGTLLLIAYGMEDVFNMMQSTVAILAVAALAYLVVTHHRREGQVLTQTQEEMLLIGAFGLFWFGSQEETSEQDTPTPRQGPTRRQLQGRIRELVPDRRLGKLEPRRHHRILVRRGRRTVMSKSGDIIEKVTVGGGMEVLDASRSVLMTG
ncbi:hypothetical protein EIP91_000673 [Steccherinum ochraceum]|uniref:MARVEL domain-containing protein n=1 Tax=Steccherinum ochraceum TaxID=92696 RepID=A0A4R0RJF1_9APHY|nr:hypothetical protein EIP91_000673 [Steccherinum ochraceum]